MSRVLYLGQKPIGEECFDVLLETQQEGFAVCGAVSNSEAEGHWWRSNSVRMRCIDRGVSFIDNKKKNEEAIAGLIDTHNIDTIISVQHTWILPPAILDKVNGDAYNLHLAKLPDYKGYHGVSHAILNSDPEYTVTIHKMAEQVDSGSIVFTRSFAIDPSDSAMSLYDKACLAGFKIFKDLAAMLARDQPIPTQPMDGGGRFYGRDSLDKFREIQDIKDADESKTKARAFYFPPFEPAFCRRGGQKLYVLPHTFRYPGDSGG